MPKKSAPAPAKPSWFKTWWWLIPAYLPAVYLLILLIRTAVNVPFWDEWEMVNFFQKHDAGTLSLYDFWTQHNEHRLLFPQLLIYVMAYIDRWNLAAEVMVNFVLALAGFILLWDMIRRTFRANPRLKIVLVVLASVLCFSPMQWENWLWGWQIEWYMVVLAVIFTIWTLCFWPERWARWKIPVALVSAFIATYSLGSGPVIWFIGLGLLLLYKVARKYVWIWISAAAVTLASFYYHYSAAAGQPPKSLLLHEPLKFVVYVCAYIGRPLAFNIVSSVIIGGLLLLAGGFVVYASWKKRTLIKRLLPWYGLAAFGGFSALTTAISRLGYGIQQGFSNRYMTISLLFTISVVVMSIAALQELKLYQRFKMSILIGLAALISLVLWNYRAGMGALDNHSQYLKDIQHCSDQTHPSDVCLLSAYPNKDVVLPMIRYLQHKHWAGY